MPISVSVRKPWGIEMSLLSNQRIGGTGIFAITLLLITLAILAFGAADATRRELGFPASEIWSIHILYRRIVLVGVIAAASMTIPETFRRNICMVDGNPRCHRPLLLLCAPSLYRDPPVLKHLIFARPVTNGDNSGRSQKSRGEYT
jgi:hypothetical protein